MSKFDYDVVVVGAGSAGMVAGEVAPRMGVRCALVERARVGGDCLWTGCVPSKALIASARAAHLMRTAADFGLPQVAPEIETAAVFERVRRIQQEIAATDDNPQKYTDAGVAMLRGEARLADGHTLEIDGRRISSEFVLLATGSRPAHPAIDGIEDAGYLTSETLFEQPRAPRSLLIVGGGPIAMEMAQAHHRLGTRVTVLQRGARILERDEPALADELLAILRAEGIVIELGVLLESAAKSADGKTLRGTIGGMQRSWTADEILVAAGRTPNVDALALDRSGVRTTARGVAVDAQLRTSLESVYACGDVAGRFLFTHSASAEAVVALRNMFFPGGKDAPEMVPWATFTEPELAHAGMTSTEAREKLGDGVRAYDWEFSHNDRARAEGAPAGRVVAVTDAKFRLLGAHILAPNAGEMIGQFTLAIEQGLRLTPDFGNLIQVYPTFSTSFSQVAAEATYGQLGKPFLQGIRRVYSRFR